MAASTLLDRLQRVRPVGKGRWVASCPAHEDRSPSLSIRELDDGRLLLHDFGGCSVGDVVAAVGLQLSDLFPPEIRAPNEPRKPQRPGHWHAAREALHTLRTEVLIVALAAERVLRGEALSDVDRDRVIRAAALIRGAAECCR